MKTIIGVKLESRADSATEFQNILSSFGCGIKTRIGLHDTFEGHCSNSGIVLLDVVDDSAEILFFELSKKWECKKMVF